MFVKVVEPTGTHVYEGIRVSYHTIWDGADDAFEREEYLLLSIGAQDGETMDVRVKTGRVKKHDETVTEKTVVSSEDFAFVYIMNDAGETVERLI